LRLNSRHWQKGPSQLLFDLKNLVVVFTSAGCNWAATVGKEEETELEEAFVLAAAKRE